MATVGLSPAIAQQPRSDTEVNQMHTAARSEDSEAQLIEIVDMCIRVVQGPEFAKDRLKFAGWTDLGPDSSTLPVYRESGAGLFEKGPALLSFLAKESSFGQQNPDAYYPVCEAFLIDPKLSVTVASSALADHLDTDGIVHDAEDDELGTQHLFVAQGHAVSIADMVKQPGTLQIMVMPDPSDTENPK